MSFLQTEQWANFQKSLGRRVLNFRNGVAHGYEHDIPFLKKIYFYVPYLDFASDDLNAFLDFVQSETKNHAPFFLKIEPLTQTGAHILKKTGFHKSKKEIQPQKTWILNLKNTEAHLLSHMSAKTRYNINLAKRKGVTITQDKKLEVFWRLLQKTSARDKFHTHSRKYFETFFDTFLEYKNTKEPQAQLWVGWFNRVPIASALVMYYEKTAHYLHGASDNVYRNVMAPHLMHWEIIQDARKGGCDLYDFWGVDEKKWPGVTRFKKSFGGQETNYPGSFDLPFSNWYFLYDIAQKIKEQF